MPQHPRHPKRRQSKTRFFLLLIMFLSATTVTWAVTQTQPSAFAAPSISPYVWGTNLSLYNGQDLFLTNQNTLKLTQQLHVQFIRFPYRGNLAVTTAAAKQIAAIHAVPLLILRYGDDQVDTNRTLIQMMNAIFGNETVYYEYGDEVDLPENGGIGAATYAASWNVVLPQLKPLAKHGIFIGPTNYHANASYISTFLKQANPRPDAVSWHEYTCGTKDPDTTCMEGITRWGTHIQEARSAMQQAIGSILPIMITEYNWNPNAQADPRTTNSTFLAAWMSAAVAELIKDNVFAANQYVLTNNIQFAMIADSTHTLTAVGTVFQSTFEQAQSQMLSPTSTTTPPATLTPNPTSTAINTPTTTATTPSGSASLLCFQEQAQTTANTQPRFLCIPLVNGSGKAVSGQPVGTLCFPLYPAQQTSTPLTINTVCVPVYTGTAPVIPTSSPTPVVTVSSTPSVTPLLTPTPSTTS